MPNTTSVRASLILQFTTDTNLVTSPLFVLANRSYQLVDFNIAVTAANADGQGGVNETRLRLDEVDAAGAVALALGTIPTTAATPATLNTWRRPTTTAITAAPAAAADTLIAAALVDRGLRLRITAAASGAGDATVVRAQGTICVFPGNRYKDATSASSYYANNSASGAVGSNATQSI
jgi:hypothetical protein